MISQSILPASMENPCLKYSETENREMWRKLRGYLKAAKTDDTREVLRRSMRLLADAIHSAKAGRFHMKWRQ